MIGVPGELGLLSLFMACQSAFRHYRFPRDIILCAVTKYLRYPLLYQDVVEPHDERSMTVGPAHFSPSTNYAINLKLTVQKLLPGRRMAGCLAVSQHRFLCRCRIFCAACARSEKIQGTSLGSNPSFAATNTNVRCTTFISFDAIQSENSNFISLRTLSADKPVSRVPTHLLMLNLGEESLEVAL